MNKRQLVCGRDCTLSLYQNNTVTAIPYTTETLRIEPIRYALADTIVGERQREHTNGTIITGCFITLLTATCIVPLMQLITQRNTPFDLILDRVQSKLIYRNLLVLSFELRGRLDEPIYLRIDVRSTQDSYIDNWTPTTPNLIWQKEHTWYLRRNCWTSANSSTELTSAYLFSLTGNFAFSAVFGLALYFPLSSNAVFGSTIDLSIISLLLLTLGEVFTIELKNIAPRSDMIDASTVGELLINRWYIIEENITFTLKTPTNSWQGMI